MGSALRLHPLLVIFGLLAGGEIYGLRRASSSRCRSSPPAVRRGSSSPSASRSSRGRRAWAGGCRWRSRSSRARPTRPMRRRPFRLPLRLRPPRSPPTAHGRPRRPRSRRTRRRRCSDRLRAAYSSTVSTFPATRLRRLRRTGALRALVRETRLDLDDFVMPLFVGPRAAARTRRCPAMGRCSVDERRARGRGARRGRRPRRDPVRDPGREGRGGLRRVGRRRHRPAGAARAAAALPRARAAHRRLPLRVHRRTATAACSSTARSTTTRRSSCSRARRSATSRPAPTPSARAT